MNIEVGKLYRTRSGQKVRIYAIDGEGSYCIHGAVLLATGWDSSEWTMDGVSIYDSLEDIVTLDYPDYESDIAALRKYIVPTRPIFDEAAQGWVQMGNSFNAVQSTICTCCPDANGAHSSTCPNNKDLSLDELADLAAQHMTSGIVHLDPGEDLPIGVLKPGGIEWVSPSPKCECGSESVGSSGHSSYCPKFEE